MELQAQDVIDCTRNQRNAAFNEAAQFAAQVMALQRENDELKAENAKLKEGK